VRAGSCPDEHGERDFERVGDEEQVGVPGISRTGFVSLDGAAFHTNEVAELLLREARAAAGGADALAQFSAASDGPLGQWGSS
jgi:hypothetical protein